MSLCSLSRLGSWWCSPGSSSNPSSLPRSPGALALAVVAHPLHGWLARRIKKPGLAAGIAVFAIALVLTGLVIFVGQTLVSSIATGTQTFQSFFQGGQWREQLARIPWLGSLLAALEQQVNLGGQLQSMAGEVGKRASELAAGSVWVLVQVVLTFFVLFYLFRDRRKALGTVRSLVPLSEKETIKYSLGFRTPFMPPSSARSRSLRCKARSAA